MIINIINVKAGSTVHKSGFIYCFDLIELFRCFHVYNDYGFIIAMLVQLNYTLRTTCTLNDYQYSFQIKGAYPGVAQSMVLSVRVYM